MHLDRLVRGYCFSEDRQTCRKQLDTDCVWCSRIEHLGGTLEGLNAFSSYCSGIALHNPGFLQKWLDRLTVEHNVPPRAIVAAMHSLNSDSTGFQRLTLLIQTEQVTPLEIAYILGSSPWMDTLTIAEYIGNL